MFFFQKPFDAGAKDFCWDGCRNLSLSFWKTLCFLLSWMSAPRFRHNWIGFRKSVISYLPSVARWRKRILGLSVFGVYQSPMSILSRLSTSHLLVLIWSSLISAHCCFSKIGGNNSSVAAPVPPPQSKPLLRNPFKRIKANFSSHLSRSLLLQHQMVPERRTFNATTTTSLDTWRLNVTNT